MSRTDRQLQVGEAVAVRITSILACPNSRCGRVLYSPRPRIGETWMSCNRGDGWSQRSIACGQHWLNITLPAESTGDDLARIMGRDEAIALLWRLQIEPAALIEDIEELDRDVVAEFLTHRLLANDDGQPIHVQIPCRRRDEHLYRYAPIRSFLRAIQLAS